MPTEPQEPWPWIVWAPVVALVVTILVTWIGRGL